MKTSVLALLFLALLAGAAYWLQRTGQINIPGWASVAPSSPTQPSGNATPSQQGGGQGAGQRRPSPVEVAAAEVVPLSDDINAIGTLLSDASADIAPETDGRVTEILFQDGAKVRQGDVLFKLADDLITAEVADAKAKLALAEATYNRNDALRRTRTVAESVYEQAKTELALARTALALAEVSLSKLSIRAPFDGTLGFSRVSIGAYVTAGAPLVHLEKIDRLKASFSVPELEFSRLAVGQQVEVTADAVRNERFLATITAVDPLVESSGRALKVLAILDNSQNKLRPGMLIRATIKGEPRQAVVVPEAAIVPRDGGSVVFILSEDAAKATKVATGKRHAGTVEVTSGLEGDEQVIVAGNQRLADGAKVAVVPPPTN